MITRRTPFIVYPFQSPSLWKKRGHMQIPTVRGKQACMLTIISLTFSLPPIIFRLRNLFSLIHFFYLVTLNESLFQWFVHSFLNYLQFLHLWNSLHEKLHVSTSHYAKNCLIFCFEPGSCLLWKHLSPGFEWTTSKQSLSTHLCITSFKIPL